MILTLCLWCVGFLLQAAPLQSADAVTNEYEDDIRKFEEQDRVSGTRTGRILFLGSSSIRLWDLNAHFPGLDVLNRGFGGSEISDSIFYYRRVVLPYRPRIIVFYAGDNDIANGKSSEQVLRDFTEFAEMVRASLPQTRVIYISIKPSPSRWRYIEDIRKANRLIERYAATKSFLTYLDVFSAMIRQDGSPRGDLFTEDDLHLNESGYRLWTAALRPLLLDHQNQK